MNVYKYGHLYENAVKSEGGGEGYADDHYEPIRIILSYYKFCHLRSICYYGELYTPALYTT